MTNNQARLATDDYSLLNLLSDMNQLVDKANVKQWPLEKKEELIQECIKILQAAESGAESGVDSSGDSGG